MMQQQVLYISEFLSGDDNDILALNTYHEFK